MSTPQRGEYGHANAGMRSVIVGFKDKLKGEIVDNPTRSTKYVVFVEQSGDYRMGTTRISNWKSEHERIGQ